MEDLRGHGPIHIKALFFNFLERLNKSAELVSKNVC
jgi:hypothetical protein